MISVYRSETTAVIIAKPTAAVVASGSTKAPRSNRGGAMVAPWTFSYITLTLTLTLTLTKN